MTLVLPLLFAYLLAGQFVRRLNMPVVLGLLLWTVLVVGVNVFLLS